MKLCPYCGFSNSDTASECRDCGRSFAVRPTTVYQADTHWVGPLKAREIRRKALSAVVVGLLIMVYWGGYGPWPVVDNPTLKELRLWFEPLLIYGGAVLYLLGWALKFI
jgi:hypothetical protein